MGFLKRVFYHGYYGLMKTHTYLEQYSLFRIGSFCQEGFENNYEKDANYRGYQIERFNSHSKRHYGVVYGKTRIFADYHASKYVNWLTYGS